MRNLALAAVSLAFSLAVGELALRASGYKPWRTAAAPPVEPTWHDRDPELGWWLRPGHWRYGPYTGHGAPVEVSIGSDRTRRTRAEDAPPAAATRPELVLLGCSFTFGWAVSDDETWAWQLQALRPDLDVRNRGTAAYGTFQSLLLLERVLAAGERPAHVLYGYIPEQETRNVAEPHWLKLLAAVARFDTVAVPYCTLDERHRLVRHPPVSYPAWPLHTVSATVALLESAWASWSAAARTAQEEEVTRQLVTTMAELCRAHGIRFSLVALHDGDGRDTLVPFAREHGIDVIDCERPLGPDEIVRGEGAHPNAHAHAAWGSCVANALNADPRLRLGSGTDSENAAR